MHEIKITLILSYKNKVQSMKSTFLLVMNDSKHIDKKVIFYVLGKVRKNSENVFFLGSINLEQMTICNQLRLRMLDGWQFPNNRGDKLVIFEPKALKAVLGEDILKF